MSPAVGTGNFITKWDLAGATETRTTAVVMSAAGGLTLQSVWATTRASILSGTAAAFGPPLACESAGMLVSEWTPIPAEALAAGDVFIGFVLECLDAVGNLSFGVTEIRVR